MTLYLVVFIFLVILYLSLHSLIPKRQANICFVSVATLIWVFISGFRHLSVGADTYNYFFYFDEIKLVNWSEIYASFKNVYFHSMIPKGIPDIGYLFIEKAVSDVYDNYHFFLILIALLFFIPMGFWIYRYSDNTLISFLLFSALFYAFFAITGHRQVIASSLVIFFGFKYILNKNAKMFFLLVFIASFIHKSVLIYAPFYFFAHVRINRNFLILSLFLFLFIFLNKESVSHSFKVIGGYEQYSVYDGAGTNGFTSIFLIIFLVIIFVFDKLVKNNSINEVCVKAVVIALLLLPLTYVNPSAMRAVQYFSIYLIILIPNLLMVINDKYRSVFSVLLVSLLFYLLYNGNGVYHFFWENP